MLLFQLFSSGFIIAQTSKVGEEASRITEDGAAASAAIAESMNGLWDDVLSGGLYGAIAQLGVFFGVGTLLLFVVQWAKDMVDGDNPKAFSELIWPLVVVVLLSNQAQPLAAATRGLREIINQTNQTLLTSTSASIQLQEAYQRAMADIGSQDAARSLLTQCESIADPQQRRECMENAIAQAKQIADSSPNGGKGWFPDFGVSEFFNTNVFQLAVRGWLIAFSIAFQWMIEISMLLTALMGPLAVGGSLLPVGQKAIFAWLTGFFSVGMVKVSFNIISGLVATLVVNAEENDPMIFAFATGLLAPILAMAIAEKRTLPIARLTSTDAEYLPSLASSEQLGSSKLEASWAHSPIARGLPPGDLRQSSVAPEAQIAQVKSSQTTSDEVTIPRATSGSNKQGFNVQCEKDCAHIELSGSPLVLGKQWISGKYQLVQGGKGILASVNGGKEPTGRHPFGDAFKVVVWDTSEVDGMVSQALFFRACMRKGLVDLGCTPYFIGPIPWLTYKENEPIFLGLVTGSAFNNSVSIPTAKKSSGFSFKNPVNTTTKAPTLSSSGNCSKQYKGASIAQGYFILKVGTMWYDTARI